jgi:DNA anti-recombination protein RmuC
VSDDDYERGHLAGEIAARLADHDRHFEKINGSMERVATELHALNLNVQSLADQAKADAVTRVATAQALKDAEEARRNKDEQAWSPITRLFAVIAAIGVVAGMALTAYIAFH